MTTPTFSKINFSQIEKRVSPIEWGRKWKMRVHRKATLFYKEMLNKLASITTIMLLANDSIQLFMVSAHTHTHIYNPYINSLIMIFLSLGTISFMLILSLGDSIVHYKSNIMMDERQLCFIKKCSYFFLINWHQ